MAKNFQPLRVLSYNIHKGFSSRNARFVLKWIRDGIRETNADLVLLQEVLGHHELHPQNIEDYPKGSQFEYLADGVWSHYAYGKNAVYNEGHHGNAILSKYPIESWNNLDLSTNRWEQRGLLHATLRLPDAKPLHVFSLHLNLLEGGRRKQVDRICEYVRNKVGSDDRVLLGGDSNDWRERLSESFRRELSMKETFETLHGRHAVSFPSFLPVLALDRLYFRGISPSAATVLKGALWSRLSDHLALYAEYAFDDASL